jgi:hypothetical protein
MTVTMSSVCVFCGSSPGADPAFLQAARQVGRLIARRGLCLVYGGADVGLMGALADAALHEGGHVRGVITHALEAKNIVHRGLTELRVVRTMHERKSAMAELADAFLMLPGGFGTWEEFLEVVTWNQLGLHQKPCGVLNVNGFFSPLLELVDIASEQRFVCSEHRGMVIVESDAGVLLDRLEAWTPVMVDKWLDRPDH